MRKVGVTGTRSGMTKEQFESIDLWLVSQNEPGELHFGDCVGVDAEVANLAKYNGWKVICHPPIKDDLRAFVPADEYREPKSYFARNRAIVDETEVLLVVPYQTSHQNHGGTWYTHDYAKKKNSPVIIFYPELER